MLTEATTHNLKQLKSILEQLTDKQFTTPLVVLDKATIGMHVRHILEFYNCLINAQSQGTLDYDTRKRDILLETSTNACIVSITHIIDSLNSVKGNPSLQLIVNYSTDPDIDHTVGMVTSFYRELQYNIEHTVHHYAILKIGINALDTTVTLDKDFGVAPSTIRNRKLCVQ
ncbi:hypothetical protein [Ascidiimonas aurantiaca]|uniref:hypothetical protein n=1 Tax=Ascidiimonas aurantiaca TaxID=1685432 RepID=UPI0030EB925C